MPTRATVNAEFVAIHTYLVGVLALASDGRYPQLALSSLPAEDAQLTIDGSVKPSDRTESLNDACAVVLSRASLLAAAVDEYDGPYGTGAFLRCRYVGSGVTVERGKVLTGTDPAFADYDWRTITA